MSLSQALPIFLCGFLSIPLAFMLNLFHEMRNPVLVLVAGTLSLSLVIAIPFVFKKTSRPRHDSFYYGKKIVLSIMLKVKQGIQDFVSNLWGSVINLFRIGIGAVL